MGRWMTMREQKTYFATQEQAHIRSGIPGRPRWPVDVDEYDGGTGIVEVRPGRGLSVVVHVRREEIQQVAPAKVWVDLVDTDDEILASGSVQLRASKKADRSFRVRVDPRVVRKHVIWGAVLSCCETVHLRWQVQVVDRTGQVLGRQMVGHEMRGS